jgi:hypothetical protein
MKEWLEDTGLSSESVDRLFRALKNIDTQEMNFDEFLEALSHMKGPPRASTMMVLSYESRKLSELVTLLLRTLGVEVDPPMCDPEDNVTVNGGV